MMTPWWEGNVFHLAGVVLNTGTGRDLIWKNRGTLIQLIGLTIGRIQNLCRRWHFSRTPSSNSCFFHQRIQLLVWDQLHRNKALTINIHVIRARNNGQAHILVAPLKENAFVYLADIACGLERIIVNLIQPKSRKGSHNKSPGHVDDAIGQQDDYLECSKRVNKRYQ
eukprot:XP_001704985.1 Hypothetical protein GL50803_86484 [Giardia lamblia ATCC 50803]